MFFKKGVDVSDLSAELHMQGSIYHVEIVVNGSGNNFSITTSNPHTIVQGLKYQGESNCLFNNRGIMCRLVCKNPQVAQLLCALNALSEPDQIVCLYKSERTGPDYSKELFSHYHITTYFIDKGMPKSPFRNEDNLNVPNTDPVKVNMISPRIPGSIFLIKDQPGSIDIIEIKDDGRGIELPQTENKVPIQKEAHIPKQKHKRTEKIKKIQKQEDVKKEEASLVPQVDESTIDKEMENLNTVIEQQFSKLLTSISSLHSMKPHYIENIEKDKYLSAILKVSNNNSYLQEIYEEKNLLMDVIKKHGQDTSELDQLHAEIGKKMTEIALKDKKIEEMKHKIDNLEKEYQKIQTDITEEQIRLESDTLILRQQLELEGLQRKEELIQRREEIRGLKIVAERQIDSVETSLKRAIMYKSMKDEAKKSSIEARKIFLDAAIEFFDEEEEFDPKFALEMIKKAMDNAADCVFDDEEEYDYE